ncbi:catalase family protein [Streptomyces sp. BPTC-684]|uniref:catalase family protein n=1 Tax=Streptomyces sp. BPTC-684 TaxID=3043734 RepID=UPI0024B1FFAE|nr:catalase family protein [Streptomyces sp. BPTC-684]WHM35448.1 catalase family protein [Streptomyces sp. BPTC-684]
MTTPHTYVKYRPDLEQPFPDEEELIRQVVEAMGKANQQVADKHRHGLRDAHAKSHGVLAGELRIQASLPAHLAQGLFAEQATYPVIVRFSSAPGDLRSDQVPVQRGIAIKVIGAPDPRALDDGHTTQDFLLVNHPTLPFGNIAEYAKLQDLLEKQPRQSDQQLQLTGLAARAAAKALTRVGRPLPPAVETLAAANHHILGETFHSMAALRYGDHVAKISAAPRSANVRALTGRPVEKKAGESALRDLVVDFFAHNSAEYDIRAQLCTDIDRMPVEDASILWPEELSPHEVVAVLHLPAQDAYSDARRRYADDVLSFSPWHALETHRPLGSIMRSRRAAYPSSSDFRHRLNGIDPQEPASIKELPA